jgi:hypothetical protein
MSLFTTIGLMLLVLTLAAPDAHPTDEDDINLVEIMISINNEVIGSVNGLPTWDGGSR